MSFCRHECEVEIGVIEEEDAVKQDHREQVCKTMVCMWRTGRVEMKSVDNEGMRIGRKWPQLDGSGECVLCRRTIATHTRYRQEHTLTPLSRFSHTRQLAACVLRGRIRCLFSRSQRLLNSKLMRTELRCQCCRRRRRRRRSSRSADSNNERQENCSCVSIPLSFALRLF